MAGTLGHRGPDGAGSWLAPSGRCALAHTRLKVIDLETGDQPMGTHDGRLHVVFNGEIYNFLELRGQLEARGHRFLTRSDTEVLLHGYREWGEALPERLEGMFAFALWDDGDRTLFLSRDRAGEKPLFLYRARAGLAFASEVGALLRSPLGRPGFRPRGLAPYLALGYTPGRETLLEDVSRLPPATSWRVDSRGWVRERRYWRWQVRPQPTSTTAARRRIRRLLTRAVESRLVADVPMGAYLSGGVDSAAVVGLMSRARTDQVRTFSVGFDDPVYDESTWARISAEAFGTRHTHIPLQPPEPGIVDDLVRVHGEPFADSSAIPVYLLSRVARSEVTVALTGDGGDELFAGYARLSMASWAEGLPRWALLLAARAGALLPAGRSFRSVGRRARRLVAAMRSMPEEPLLALAGALGPELKTLLRDDRVPVPGASELVRRGRGEWGPTPGMSPLSRALSLNFETYLPGDLLVKADRASMAHGLELRAPFLDTDLMEAAGALPDGMRVRLGRRKAILKEAVDDLVPREILHRPKRGFGVPLASWFRGPWRTLLEDRLLERDGPLWDWIRRDAVRSMVDDHLTGRADRSHGLWTLLTLHVWMEALAGVGGEA